jgi:hypothetical protein
MNLVTRMDSYFTNFTMPWEKKDKSAPKTVLTEDAVSSVGQLQHFKVVETNKKGKMENQWACTPTWAKTFAS